LKTAVICVAAALGVLFLKRAAPELALLLSLAAAAAVLSCVFTQVRSAAGLLEGLLDSTGLDREFFVPLLKIVGVSLVARLGADLCKDAGQSALSSLVELSGTLCALLAAAPLLAAAAQILGGWLLT